MSSAQDLGDAVLWVLSLRLGTLSRCPRYFIPANGGSYFVSCDVYDVLHFRSGHADEAESTHSCPCFLTPQDHEVRSSMGVAGTSNLGLWCIPSFQWCSVEIVQDTGVLRPWRPYNVTQSQFAASC